MKPIIALAVPSDAAEILSLQKRAFITEAQRYNNHNISPLTQTIDELLSDFSEYQFLKAVIDDTIVGSVKIKIINGKCWVGRLMVDPGFRKRGIGMSLLLAVEEKVHETSEYFLFTGIDSMENIRLYEKAGYRRSGESIVDHGITLIGMRKLHMNVERV
jgi:GNAT superfamily N-acetyltransferase